MNKQASESIILREFPTVAQRVISYHILLSKSREIDRKQLAFYEDVSMHTLQ
jgi:hypothetical protein